MYVSLNVNAIERGRHISVPMNRVAAHFLNTVAGTLGTMVKGNSVATNELSHWKVLSRGASKCFTIVGYNTPYASHWLGHHTLGF